MSYPAQTDQRTCGIAALAAFVARNDRVRGENFVRYCSDASVDSARFQADLHRVASRVGMPWPRTLGTSPWALAALASEATGYRYRLAIWSEANAQLVRQAWESGADILIYTGERLIPRHVVLLLGRGSAHSRSGTQQVATVFEPSVGRLYEISPDELTVVKWSGKAGKAHWGWWTRPLLAVVPDLTHEIKENNDEAR